VIVVDTGVLHAAADRRDVDHDASVALLDGHPSDELAVPATVVTETALIIRSRLDDATEQAFVASVAAGDFTVVDLTEVDYQRCAEAPGRLRRPPPGPGRRQRRGHRRTPRRRQPGHHQPPRLPRRPPPSLRRLRTPPLAPRPSLLA